MRISIFFLDPVKIALTAEFLLPSEEDNFYLRSKFRIMVSRILVQHLPFLKLTFGDVVEWHVKHRYSAEMSAKSVVISCYKTNNRNTYLA